MTKKKRSDKGKKIFIVDDHPIVRQGLVQLIEQENDLNVCGEAESVYEALKGIKASKPAQLIVDLVLKESNGMDLIKQIKAQHPRVNVLVLSMHDESLYVERSLRAGAKGYLTKEETTEKLIKALRRVLEGRTYLSERFSEKIISRLSYASPGTGRTSIEALSNRELEVFELYGRGLGTRQIAERLNRSIKTVQAHRENIKKKLKLESFEELIPHAVHWVHRRLQK